MRCSDPQHPCAALIVGMPLEDTSAPQSQHVLNNRISRASRTQCHPRGIFGVVGVAGSSSPEQYDSGGGTRPVVVVGSMILKLEEAILENGTCKPRRIFSCGCG